MKDLLELLLNKHARFEHYIDLYNDDTADPAARMAALQILANARDLSAELSSRWPALRRLVQDLNDRDKAAFADMVLSKLKDPILNLRSRELIIMESPGYYRNQDTAQPVLDLFRDSSDQSVKLAALNVVAASPNLATAQISAPLILALLSAVRDPSMRTNALAVLSKAAFRNPLDRVQAAEALISQKMHWDAQGMVFESQMLERFLSQTPGFRNILQDVFNDVFDYRVRLEALRLASLPVTVNPLAINRLIQNFLTPRNFRSRRAFFQALAKAA